ncbi:MAG: flavodoxin [Clostridiales bacterium]|nr:MAG: flavodoxin [Clostridiales bacterium]
MSTEKQKILVAYFSHRGENYFNGKLVNLTVGNTELAAKLIAEETHGDLFEIKTVKKYPFVYQECTIEAQNELRVGSRPALAEGVDISGYDMIFLGYPNWWGTMPMPVWTFLEAYDFSSKIIFPFCTHEGSGMGKSERDLKEICPMTKVLKGLPIRGTEVKDAERTIKAWLKNNLEGL